MLGIWVTENNDLIESVIPWAKLIVPPTLAPGTQEDQTSLWLVIAGDPGYRWIARQFLAGAE